MNKTGVLQFIYCCPFKFATAYKKVLKEFKKGKCEILEMTEEIIPNHYIPYGNRFVNDRSTKCSKCRGIKTFSGIRVTIKYEIHN